jgi:hypothetical protein
MSRGPLARSADLIVDNIGDELLVYDTSTNRAHSLNTVSAAVWKACDGTRNANEIAVHIDLDLAAVELALDNLSDVELISGHRRTGISRRTALRRITVGAAGLAVALPVIRSISAPTAAMAGSACDRNGSSCDTTASCCSGISDCLFSRGHSKCRPIGFCDNGLLPCTTDASCCTDSYCAGTGRPSGVCYGGTPKSSGQTGCIGNSSCAFPSFCVSSSCTQ